MALSKIILSGDFNPASDPMSAENTIILIALDSTLDIEDLKEASSDLRDGLDKLDLQELELSHTGNYLVTSDIDRIGNENVIILGIAIVILVTLVLAFTFRRVSYVLLPLTTLAIAIVWTLATMTILGLDFTLIDIGGQDTKVVKIVQGRMVDFQTNDKCAASSGRYLENMAAVLDISLDEMGQHYKDPVTLSSTCAVFGESEVIGCLAEGKPIEAICAGVNYSVVRRVMPDVRRMPSGHYVLSGGVGRNNAVRHLLEQELRTKLIVPENHFFLGAIGCCNAQ